MIALHTRHLARGRAAVALAVAIGVTTPATMGLAASPGPSRCGGTGYRVLIVHADAFQGRPEPTVLRAALLADPDVDVVHLFNAFEGTPTLAQLQAYEIVYTYSSYNGGYQDPVTLGDNLADHVDRDGIVFAAHQSFNGVHPFSIEGRWLTDGYSPYAYTPVTLTNAVTLRPSHRHPLMQGVSILNAGFRLNVMVASGATQVATYSDGSSTLAVKGRAIGMPVYLGNLENPGTGDYARVIANAGRWLHPLACLAPDE